MALFKFIDIFFPAQVFYRIQNTAYFYRNQLSHYFFFITTLIIICIGFYFNLFHGSVMQSKYYCLNIIIHSDRLELNYLECFIFWDFISTINKQIICYRFKLIFYSDIPARRR